MLGDILALKRLAHVLIGGCLVLACRPASAQSLTVAAASDLQSALPEIVAQFEKQTRQHVRLTFGSSGNFFTQIQNGAPFDVYLSADIDYPRRLEASGEAEPGSLCRYATGRIVLWTRNDSGIDVRRGLMVLDDARVRRIALANPEHAPYGRAAVAAFRHEGLDERIREKFVLGENVSQAAQFAESGAADVAILALALALSPRLKRAGTYVDIPGSWYPPIEQGAVILTSSKLKPLARQFVDHLKTPESIRILQSYGFDIPQTSR
jgi:molybdate transport system substrate-binding protein